VRLGINARQRDLHRAFIGAVRRGVGARQRVAFAVRPMESARQILWRTAKVVFPVVHPAGLSPPGETARHHLINVAAKSLDAGE
jgi:hypothetical protein